MNASASTLDWPHCPVDGCTGRSAVPSGRCVAHLRPDRFARLLDGLRPGRDLDLRGVAVPAPVLDALLAALRGPDGRPHLGRARFDRAVLPAGAAFTGACFEGDASFDGTAFAGHASFYDARFLGHVSFHGARFGGNVTFHTARFHRHASFEGAVLGGDALFGETSWHADARFDRAAFVGAAAFDRARFGRDLALRGARFTGHASFRRVEVGRNLRLDRSRFRRDARIGPLAAHGALVLDGLTAHEGLHVHAAAPQITARRAAVSGGGDFRLRSAALDAAGASFRRGLDVRALARPLAGVAEPPDEPARVLSLRDVRAPHLALTDVDLSRCRLLGATGDLRLAGRCTFPAERPRLTPWRTRAHVAEDAGVRGARPGDAGRGRGPRRAGPGGADPAPDARLPELYARLAGATGGALARDFRHRALRARRRAERDPWRRLLLGLLWVTVGYGLGYARCGVRTALWLAVFVALVVTGARHVHPTPRRPHPAPSRAALTPPGR
ncbi:pentapeptide repeat-containing protein [Actinomadura atramentaria]|uniref:pentapeptide repeat-containing protein n=1 Tax=Actinomadura atramentaria TaxID=1990 RepID=UPI0003A0D040|nr:pentapeptide repeat-containing protein [Actinomadura atramentaria]